MIATMRPESLRLQSRRDIHGTGQKGSRAARYRFARPNGWHCGHWHATPEDALGCAVRRGAYGTAYAQTLGAAPMH
jgi:hypothetical protein